MNQISIQAVAAAHTVASTIEGFGEPVEVVDRETGATCVVPPLGEFADYCELNLQTGGGDGARVTIERPRRAFGSTVKPAEVTWPSSGRSDARSMCRLLDFAVRVAEQLDVWAAAGQLPRLAVDEQTGRIEAARAMNDAAIERAREVRTLEPQVGDLVDVAIYAPGPGGSSERPVGHLRGYVTVAAGEFNVGLIDDEEDVADTLDRADVNADDLPLADGSGSVPLGTPILENCQREWLTVIERPEATR